MTLSVNDFSRYDQIGHFPGWKDLNGTTKNFQNQHVIIFEEDLCQLVKRLKQLVYLNIYGRIRYEKVESYRLMVQRRFPNSRFDIEISRFRLWR
ncbi:unnamed protein product [Rotaria sordida]|uniref:Uncharacterized protein n=1 Tax=Rotaria sordida TaxID=392033 RepID=A0A813UFG2_9BILA|nr:unnamed protein product [Rotaria sordida]CAF0827036.1 unnamed protein product [Rotaria sordida]CAF0834802.1 unnamed protein product [Rotaria sordida]